MKKMMLVLLFAAFYSMFTAGAEAAVGSISGTVTDMETDAPIYNAAISIPNYPSKPTNINGNYVYPDLNPAVYSLTFTKTGYKSVTIPNVVVKSGAVTVLNVELTSCTTLLNITTTELPKAIVGKTYDNRVRITCGVSPITYSSF